MGRTALIAAALAGALGGCASHLSLAEPVADVLRAGMVADAAQAKRLEKALTDKDIADLLDARVRAKLPTSVAIAKVRSGCDGYQPYLDVVDANELAGWEATVSGQPLVHGVHPVSRLAHTAEKPTVRSLRQAAARMKCELLLVYLQADSSVVNFNDAAALYWTGIGLLTVPGSVLEHRTVMQGILVDCRTGVILATATGDCHLKRTFPAAFESVRREELQAEALSKAVADIQKSFRRHIGNVVSRAVATR
jgi:hypothetical protein